MRKILPLGLLAIAALNFPLSAQDWVQTWVKPGATAGDHFGYSVAAAGDHDGDGLSDVLVGALGADFNGRNSGSVYLLSGIDGSEIARLDGENLGDMFGVSVASISDLTGDGVNEIAVGAPFYSGTHFFQGRVYLFDGTTRIELGHIDGQAGDLLGVSVLGADYDGDGTTDLMVGILGGGTKRMAGAVQGFSWDGASLIPGDIVESNTTGEWFGFALANLGNVDGFAGDELLAGAPYSGDTGKLFVLGKRSGQPFRVLVSLSGAAGDQLGVSVAGRPAGNGKIYLAAGGPEANSGAGAAIVWEAPSLNQLIRLDGAAGDQLGYSLSMLEDANFDGLVDLVVGSPGATSTGLLQVLDLQTGTELYSTSGNNGSQLGWSTAVAGDTNGTGIEEVVAGAPRTTVTGNRQGLVMVISPPDSDIDPMELNLVGSMMQGEPVTVDLINVKENANIYFYAGANQNPTTSAFGFLLDIGNLIGAGGNDYFALNTNVVGGSTSAVFNVPASTPDGTILYFQAGEYRNGFTRISDVDGGSVAEHPLVLTLDSPPTAGQAIVITATYAWANKVIYFFAAQSSGNSGYLGFIVNTGLTNPQFVAQDQADGNGTAVTNWTIPATFMGHSTVGATIYFSSVSLSGSGDEKMGVIGPYTIQ